ncbi:MAG: EAL domain-containing protein [Gammaproteobacteria bacterium]
MYATGEIIARKRYQEAALPENETARLATLRHHGVLDTAPDTTLDTLTRAAARLCGTPIALITLVDANRQWFKSKVGLDVSETTRDISFCAHAILQHDVFIVPDALADVRFAENPLVLFEPKIRFYAGAPLITSEGYVLGTLCVIDQQPRQLKSEQITILPSLADAVMSYLELQLKGKEFDPSLLKSILDSMGDGVIVADKDGKLMFINPAAEQIIGRSSTEIDADPQIEQFCTYLPAMLTPGPEQEPPLLRAIRGEAFNAIEVLMSHFKARRAAWLSVTGSPLKRENGTVRGMVIVFHDSTEQKNNEQRLHYLANYDALTGLPNRTLFFDRLTQALARARRETGLAAVLFLDLDRFKGVNDTLGHDIGDLLLKAVAARLMRCVRESDTVSRLGGDEFALVLLDLAQVGDLIHIIKKIQDSLPQPYDLEGHEVFITISIGVSFYPNDGETPETLLKNADTAMYLAKEQGRNRFQHDSSIMSVRAAQRRTLGYALHHALERNQFVLHYQPFMDAKTGHITGMEALLRWHLPESGIILPSRFIPLAEETGLIGSIGEWVLHHACLQNKAWQTAGFAPLPIAVNFSSRQFHQQDMLAIVTKVLAETGLAADYLELELTESIMQNAEAISTLRGIRGIGAQISIDNFGTGYSSMNYLKHFPINKLKIDTSFIQDIPSNADNSAITAAIIALGHSLKLRVIAEGVETQEQLEFLRSLNCDEIQGYLVSKPVSAVEMSRLLASKHELFCLFSRSCNRSPFDGRKIIKSE